MVNKNQKNFIKMTTTFLLISINFYSYKTTHAREFLLMTKIQVI